MVSPRVLLKTVLFTVLVPVTVAGVIPRVLARWREHPRLPIGTSTGRVLGTASILVGTVVYLHTAWRFAAEGSGTPSPSDEPDDLVTGGLYDHVRNPMYVGVLLVVVGQALRYRSVSVLWWAAGCWLGFHNRVLEYEEPHLAEKHGERYDQYREAVPRWLPRIGRSR
ncbi:methyltransferase family protein [Natrarchaeobius chitinivorans]|uniref:Isoprenylcysteine carboxylmethyltransferase family protein n=1 Tax=Natrarchaeobius chitinivorans TaxID=1679083 RepID=A0A3N6PCP2_NATCH|nr:isoprenylcysteine carboxylmethyltransferase family protein [Natrarchaeobius chitinivorans]RQG94605.1 isoprenylcysteine carboxylmethyltransferase family protein [Natrarchaeobius chitinivorans]